MADRPIQTPLPADLPEDWTSGQIVAPAGADVGLSEQHGYNYLMAAVNRAQQAVNAINESFDDISGKRTCRVVVGTSTAGWTQADCDFLCDGVDDQEEINAALGSISGYGRVVLLSGSYSITGKIYIDGKSLQGNGMLETILNIQPGAYGTGDFTHVISAFQGELCDLGINSSSSDAKTGDILIYGYGDIHEVYFRPSWQNTCISVQNYSCRVSNCIFEGACYRALTNEKATTKATFVVSFKNNILNGFGEMGIYLKFPCIASIVGNTGGTGLNITLDSIMYCSIVASNTLHSLQLLKTSTWSAGSNSVLITGNTFIWPGFDGVVLTLGENTQNNFVVGNNLTDPTYGRQYGVLDNGINNIVRFNSNDTSSGGGVAGVSSFKGRSGAVVPQSGDYTAAMVGAVPAGSVTEIQAMTQAEYDALTAKGASTLYLIKE